MAAGRVHKDPVPGHIRNAAHRGGAVHYQARRALQREAFGPQRVVLVLVGGVKVGIGIGIVDAIPGPGGDGGLGG